MPITITLPAVEMYDPKNKKFLDLPELQIEMEHSLVSLSKWESWTRKAFLGPDEKTVEETYLYMAAMCLDPMITIETIRRMPAAEFERLNAYIGDSQTATWFSEAVNQGPRSREVVTAELVYHWMIAMTVPVDKFETWHLGRLFTQLKVINEKNKKPTKQSKQDTIAKHRARMEKNRKLMEEGAL